MRRIGLLAAIAILAVLAVFRWTSDERSEPLSVRAQQDGADILITNQGSAAISGCILTVNSTFRLPGLSLPPQQATRIAGSSLMTQTGTRFDPQSDALRRLHLDCQSPTQADVSFAAQ